MKLKGENNEVANERLLRLEWTGPFLLQNGSLHSHPAEPASPPPNKPGLYIVTGDHPLYGNHALIYIGKSTGLAGRLRDHKWLRDEWRVEIYATVLIDQRLRNDAEKLLIYENALYNDFLTTGKGWRKRKIMTATRGHNGKDYEREEIVWYNTH